MDSSIVRDIILSMRIYDGADKNIVRSALLAQKLEVIERLYPKLKKIQPIALSLLRRVDYSNIRPRLVFVSPKQRNLWRYYRCVFSSAPWTGRPGRSLFIFCIDEISGGILGILDIGSDIRNLNRRDKIIGWDRETKYGKGRLNNIVNVGTCVCSEPFGVLTGGKFQIVAITTKEIIETWHRRYGEYPAAFSTTSLYGKSSIYNRLKEWKYLGCTVGQTAVFLSQSDKKILERFLAVRRKKIRTSSVGDQYNGRYDILKAAMSVVGLSEKLLPRQPRGVYFHQTAENSISYLCGKDFKLRLKELRSQSDVCDWWLDRWYSMRFPKKQKQIASFDPLIYSIENQIEICGQAKRAGSIDSDALVNHAREGGAIPVSALQGN